MIRAAPAVIACAIIAAVGFATGITWLGWVGLAGVVAVIGPVGFSQVLFAERRRHKGGGGELVAHPPLPESLGRAMGGVAPAREGGAVPGQTPAEAGRGRAGGAPDP